MLVNFGESIASHLDAVAFMRRQHAVAAGAALHDGLTIGRRLPLDKTYYQTVKGMVAPLDILEPGGTLIIASACSEGFGSPEFRAGAARGWSSSARSVPATLLAKRYADVDEWQTEMQLKALRAGRVELYTTGSTPRSAGLTGVEPVDGVEERSRPRCPRRRCRARRHSRRTVCRPRRRLRPRALPPPATLAIHLDLVGGIAGDMFVAALVDALPALGARCSPSWRRCGPPARPDRVFARWRAAG